MKTNDVFPSKYLKAKDELFDNGEVTATIKDLTLETMGSGKSSNGNSNGANQQKAVMYFRELPKGLVMNKTNWGICEKMFKSDESDDWIGQKVALNVIETVAYGEAVKSIRISEKRPVADRQALLNRFSKRFEEAKALNVEGVEDYSGIYRNRFSIDREMLREFLKFNFRGRKSMAEEKTGGDAWDSTQWHVVKKGESLWKIAEHYYGDGNLYKKIF